MRNWICVVILSLGSGRSLAADCPAKIEERTVRGDSLSGLVEAGQEVRVLFGYYDCHEVARGDIVAYQHAGNPDPIIKVAKGLPGDRFGLRRARGGWTILVNGRVAKNSRGRPYLFGESSYRMLSLYESDYGGIIPPGAYLILGNLPGGSLDSSRFGLVAKSEILGKVLIPGGLDRKWGWRVNGARMDRLVSRKVEPK